MPALNTLYKLPCKFSIMYFIAQSNTLPVHHVMTQQVPEIWAKLYYRMKCTYCTVH